MPGNYLPDVSGFDAEFFGITAREAKQLDPQHRLLLELAWESLEDAAIPPATLRGTRCGCFIGISSSDYTFWVDAAHDQVDVYSGIGNSKSLAANRLSFFFDFTGPSFALDAACSSSLMATHLACQSLRSGESDLALAGGVGLILTPVVHKSFLRARMLSATGRCRTFDAGADGYIRSEGAGLVALKRLADAEADGDPIIALIHGSAINHNGRGHSIVAPREEAQVDVIRRALAASGVEPGQVGYLEAHGTGTPAGDAAEMRALRTVFGENRPHPCYVGSIKSNIGHLEAAAGILSLIKAAMAVNKGIIPPNLHFTTPNEIARECLPTLKVPVAPTTWPQDLDGRVAGVSSFGFGGTNCHVLVSAHERTLMPAEPAPPYLFAISARTPEVLRQLAARYVEILTENLDVDLASLCYSLLVGRACFASRLAVAVSDIASLISHLRNFLEADVDEKRTESLPAVRMMIGHWTESDSAMSAMWVQLPADATLLWNRLSALGQNTNIAAAYIHQYALTSLWISWGIPLQAIEGVGQRGEVLAAVLNGHLSLEAGLDCAAALSTGENELSLPCSRTNEARSIMTISIGRTSSCPSPELLETGRWSDASRSLARLFVAGHNPKFSAVAQVEARRLNSMVPYPFQRTRYWVADIQDSKWEGPVSRDVR